MAALWTTCSVILIVGVVVAHEAGHVRALRRYGMPVRQVGLGLPVGPRWVFRPRRASFELVVSLALIGVYVRPKHPEEAKKLPYLDYAWYLGAGRG
jgi:membrane-associated protease RseP (regulator of RpoE activity)